MKKKSIFTGYTAVFACISLAIILTALVMALFGAGMNPGIDFTGGSLLKYEIGQDFDVQVVEAVLEQQGVTESQIVKAGVGDVKTELQIRTKDLGDRGGDVLSALEAGLRETYPEARYVSLSSVGAVAGQDLIRNAVYACLIVLVCMLVYIGWRFDLTSGLAVVVVLAHDVLIMCSFMVFFRSVYQVNSPFIAALLTIIGYSINNSIVIFDRIREYSKLAKFKGLPKKEVSDAGVRISLSRTVNTTLTTLFMLVTLYVLGVTSIREFTFPLLVGMLSGVYSSVMLGSQLWAHWNDRGTFAGITRFIRGRRAKKV